MPGLIKGSALFLAQFAGEDAPFIARHIIDVTDKAFDDFAGGETDKDQIRRMLGIA